MLRGGQVIWGLRSTLRSPTSPTIELNHGISLAQRRYARRDRARTSNALYLSVRTPNPAALESKTKTMFVTLKYVWRAEEAHCLSDKPSMGCTRTYFVVQLVRSEGVLESSQAGTMYAR